MSPPNLQNYADITHAKGVSRSQNNQCSLYNGQKRVHAIKFQSVVVPNGLITNLYGPVVAKRHECGILADSGLLGDLQRYSHYPDGRPLCLYGDAAYPKSVHMQRSFQDQLTPVQREYNTTISRVRLSVDY